MKNITNNLLNSEKLVFPAFEFRDFIVQGPDVDIKWGDTKKIYDLYTNLLNDLKKALKLLYQALHPGNNKQNVSLARFIFDETTIVASSCYFPHHPVMSRFVCRHFSEMIDNCKFQTVALP